MGAGLFEVVWAYSLKRSEGFTRLWPSLVTVVALAVSLGLLARAARELPLGTAYAVWVGIGALGATLAGAAWLGEPLTLPRAFFLGLLLVALAGLKATST